jgi:glycine reductase complex component B subunit gamma
MTLVSGDNYAVENQQSIIAAVLEKVREADADLFVAGPCFQAGRYGMAAGALCSAVQAKLGIPVITGMAQENPGADLYRETLFIIDSGENAARMRDVLTRMATRKKTPCQGIRWTAERRRLYSARSDSRPFC